MKTASKRLRNPKSLIIVNRAAIVLLGSLWVPMVCWGDSEVAATPCAKAEPIRVNSGHTLGLCNEGGGVMRLGTSPSMYRVPAGEELRVVLFGKDGTSQDLLTGGGVGGNAYRVETQSAGLLVTEELVDGKTYHPFRRQTIHCVGETCQAGKVTCALVLPRNLYPDVIQRIKREKRRTSASMATSNSDGGEDYVSLVGDYAKQLFLRALSGDRESARLLMNFPFELDGAAAEVVGTYQTDYTEAKKSGCLMK